MMFTALLLFIIIPTIFTIVFPSIIIPYLVNFTLNRNKNKKPPLKLYILTLIIGGILGVLIWEFGVHDVIYHEWDPGITRYSFFGHESPSFGVGGNWLAEGWKIWHLDLMWLAMNSSIYVLALFLSGIRYRKHLKTYIVTTIMFLTITLIALVLPKAIFPTMLNFFPTHNYKEKNIACASLSDEGPKILYSRSSREWKSDLDGNNLEIAFDKDLQIRSHRGSFSPDTSQIALYWGKDLWVFCTNNSGAKKIEIPKSTLDQPIWGPTSSPSWSPDGKQIIINNQGNLLIINVDSKETKVIKSQVAFRDNNIDITSRDHDKRIPPYEIGSVYWSRDGLIYYTAFDDEKVRLHQYNLQDLKDEILIESNNDIIINSGDTTGRYLYIVERLRAVKRVESPSVEVNYVFDTESSESINKSELNLPIIWSPLGKYYAVSSRSFKIDLNNRTFDAMIINPETSEEINVSLMMEAALIKAGKLINSGKNLIEIIDFVDEDWILINVIFPSSPGSGGYPQLNGLLNFHTGELKILQDYVKSELVPGQLHLIKILH